MRSVGIPAEPRGKKRSHEEMEFYAIEKSDQPRVKRARIESDEQIEINRLFDAVAQGNISLVTDMITDSPALLSACLPEPRGMTLLCEAAAQGKGDIVSLLLGLDVPADSRNRMGATPLMFAAQGGSADVIATLCSHGADPNAFAPDYGYFPLKFAIARKNLPACQALISQGADIHRWFSGVNPRTEGKILTSALKVIMVFDYVELMTWLLDTRRIAVDWIHPSEKNMGLVHFAAQRGAASIVRLLLERGARHDAAASNLKGEYQGNAIELAELYGHFHVVECILRFLGDARPESLEAKGLQTLVAFDLASHKDLWVNPKRNPADGLTDPAARKQPWKLLESMASACVLSEKPKAFLSKLQESGWSCFFAPSKKKLDLFLITMPLFYGNAFKRPWATNVFAGGSAQQLQMLIEWMSEACSRHLPFSGMKLTAQTEQVMNQMFDLQRDLMLSAIAHLRKQFEASVQSLPGLCMNIYISRTHQLNEPDLYRKMTEEWGLYGPVAPAALRLVKEAYDKLQRVQPQHMPAQFAALSPGEQLGHVMAELLGEYEWDKIPEIAEALRMCGSTDELDLLGDLLFQQWRLFGEAFGVMKPHYTPFDVRKPKS